MAKCKMIIFSDIHYSPTAKPDGKKLTEYAIPLLEKLTDKINNDIKPDVVFCLGDIIEDNDDKVNDTKNLQDIMSYINKINVPTHIAIGNHDIRAFDNEKELEEILGMDKSTYSIDINGYHFVVLGLNVDNTFDKSGGGIPRTHSLSSENIQWLEEDLKQNTKPTIIISHYGLSNDTMAKNQWFNDIPNDALYENRQTIKDIIKASGCNVIALFNAHQHWTKLKIEDGLTYFTVGSLTENVNLDNVPDGVYFIVELEDNNIQVLDRHIRL